MIIIAWVVECNSLLGNFYTDDFHEFKIQTGDGLFRRIIGQVDALTGKVFVLLFSLVFEGDVTALYDYRVQNPFVLRPLYMRGDLRHVGMG